MKSMKKRKTLLPTYLKGLKDGKYTLKQASESTGYSIRWLWKLKDEYIRTGSFDMLDHKNRNRVPVNKLTEKFKNKVIGLYATDEYKDTNFKYFYECLNEYEHIKIGLSSVRNILNEAGIKSPEAHNTKRKIKVHRPRVRRANFGDMLQIDGTPFAWFYKFGNTKNYCMVGAIDDATSRITSLYITENECLYGYMEMMRNTIRKYGVPREIYSDRAAIFCVTPKEKKNLTIWEQLSGIHDKKTQWQRILDELNINQILAWSPEAKGRVERMWSTLQGRIPHEFFRNGIDTVEKANEFLKTYVDKFNEQFAVEPRKEDSFFLPCLKNLDDVLLARISRRSDSRGWFSFHSYKFEILDAPNKCCRDFDLCISEKGIFAQFKGDPKYYRTQILSDFLYDGLGETMPQVIKNIVYRYMFAHQKELSA